MTLEACIHFNCSTSAFVVMLQILAHLDGQYIQTCWLELSVARCKRNQREDAMISGYITTAASLAMKEDTMACPAQVPFLQPLSASLPLSNSTYQLRGFYVISRYSTVVRTFSQYGRRDCDGVEHVAQFRRTWQRLISSAFLAVLDPGLQPTALRSDRNVCKVPFMRPQEILDLADWFSKLSGRFVHAARISLTLRRMQKGDEMLHTCFM